MEDKLNPPGKVKPETGKHFKLVDNETEEKLKEKIALRLLQQKHPQVKTLEDGHIFSDGLVKYYLRDASALLELLPELAKKAGYVSPEEHQEILDGATKAQVELDELLCQGRISQAIDATLVAYEQTCERLIKEAKEQERERISNLLQALKKGNRK